MITFGVISHFVLAPVPLATYEWDERDTGGLRVETYLRKMFKSFKQRGKGIGAGGIAILPLYMLRTTL